MLPESRRSIVFVQYAGNYAETYRRICNNEPETYYAQRYSIEEVANLVNSTTSVTTIVCTGDVEEDTLLGNGVRVISMKTGVADEDRVWAAVKACHPTHLCLRTPLMGILSRAIDDASILTILLTLADSFNRSGIVAQYRHWQFRRLVNSSKVLAVGNHGIHSSRSLQRIGVQADKIIPWDWPHDINPRHRPVKSAPAQPDWKLLFVGAVVETKGIGDVLRALAILRSLGIPATLSYAGKGDAEKFADLAKDLGIAASVEYLGLIAHSEIIPRMQAADLVVVPSHHEYPEGFPMTIYEALSSRTPIVASDHPMYAPHLAGSGAAVIYAAGDAQALANAVSDLMRDPSRYRALSEASVSAWDQLQLPVTWGNLIRSWASARPGDRPDIFRHALQPSV